MVHLRLARKDSREEVPLHFEGLGLATGPRWGATVVGFVSIVAGITIMVRLAEGGPDVLGAVLASAGAVVLGAAIRCRRYETVVGARWLRWRCGPFHGDVPTNLLGDPVIRPGTGWRRLFGKHEVAVELATGQSGPVVPSDDPEELVAVLEGCSRTS